MRVRLPLLVLAASLSAALIAVFIRCFGVAAEETVGTSAANGVPPVRTYRPLMRTSSRYAKFMIANDVWAHASNPATGASYSRVGEILGMTTTPGPAPRAIVRAWLESPAHRPILLDRRYRCVGIGLEHGNMDGLMSWVWVVRLGRR